MIVNAIHIDISRGNNIQEHSKPEIVVRKKKKALLFLILDDYLVFLEIFMTSDLDSVTEVEKIKAFLRRKNPTFIAEEKQFH